MMETAMVKRAGATLWAGAHVTDRRWVRSRTAAELEEIRRSGTYRGRQVSKCRFNDSRLFEPEPGWGWFKIVDNGDGTLEGANALYAYCPIPHEQGVKVPPPAAIANTEAPKRPDAGTREPIFFGAVEEEILRAFAD